MSRGSVFLLLSSQRLELFATTLAKKPESHVANLEHTLQLAHLSLWELVLLEVLLRSP